MEEGSDGATRPPKRRKIRLACQECRDKKTRCDGGRPTCQACVRKKLGPEHCVYLDAASDLDARYVQGLEDRIRELEHMAGSGSKRDSNQPTPAIRAPQQVSNSNSNSNPNPNQNLNNSDTHDAANHLLDLQGRRSPQISTSNDFHHSPRHMGPPYSALRQQLQVPERDASPLQARLNRQYADVERQPGSTMGASDEAPDRSGNATFLGPSSAAAYMKTVQESLGHRNLSSPAVGDGMSSTTSRMSQKLQRKLKKDTAELLDKVVLPARRLADTHLAEYWNHKHPFYPILYKPSFMKRYNEVWSQGHTGHDELSHFNGNVETLRAFHATLNIAMALGCVHPRSESHSLWSAKAYYERSESLLRDANMDQGSIQLVQALILTAQYLQSTDMANRCWVITGQAIRVAQGIGVQLDRPSESQAEREERRRTWWNCILMDRVLSMTFGRPVMVVWKTIVPKPLAVDDGRLSQEPGSSSRVIAAQEMSINAFFTETLKLTDVLMSVLSNFYRPIEERRQSQLTKDPASDLTLVVEIDADLARWRQQLPPHLIYQTSEATHDREPVHGRQAALLHSRYLHLRILLFRPITMDLSNNPKYYIGDPQRSTDFQHSLLTACVRSCVGAAQELIDVLRSQQHDERNPPRWYTVFYPPEFDDDDDDDDDNDDDEQGLGEAQLNNQAPFLVDDFQTLLQDPNFGNMIWPAGSQDWLNSLPEERSEMLPMNEFTTPL